MANLNKVLLMGNLTRDIEMRYTPSGMAVAQMGLAVNRKFRDKQTNELREEVCFVDIEVWGKQAETAHQYLSKGRTVFIEGRLKFDQWDDKQTGQKRSKLKVVALQIQFINSPGGSGGSGGSGGGAPANRTPPARSAPSGRPQGGQGGQSGQGGQGDAGAPPPPMDQSSGPEPEDLEIPEENIPF